MPKTTSRQLTQPRLTLVLEYNLLRYTREDSPVMVNLVRENPDLYDFYEVDTLTYDPV
ncbi:hypothetical protein NIES4071_47090 [Calothrix sp. NIES-4071]|nr:hypothetical protein NIES4071_47090 [Calothrix sp. NIES-4071]BAZ59020.1 hypothetical protein NIES4105_47020 [Calothrix sp. NIES-4105]